MPSGAQVTAGSIFEILTSQGLGCILNGNIERDLAVEVVREAAHFT
jgi:hypothetical protein